MKPEHEYVVLVVKRTLGARLVEDEYERCTHCGRGRDDIGPGTNNAFCAARQARHDAFVAAALQGALAQPVSKYEKVDDILQSWAVTAVKLADLTMAALKEKK